MDSFQSASLVSKGDSTGLVRTASGFLTRQVCSKINTGVLQRKEIRPFTVSKYSYEKHAAEYQTEMEAVFEQILGVLEDFYPQEYNLLKTLALDGSHLFKKNLKFGDSSISHLLGYCLIKKEQDDYFIRIRSIADYLRSKHKYEMPKRLMKKTRHS